MILIEIFSIFKVIELSVLFYFYSELRGGLSLYLFFTIVLLYFLMILDIKLDKFKNV